MNKYKKLADQIINEIQLAYVVRYLDPKNGKRFAVPFKTEPDAKQKRDQLKRDGAQQLSITKDYLKGKFKEDVSKDGAYAIGMAKAKDMYNDEKPVEKSTITKAHDIAKAILRKEEAIVEFTSQQIKQAYGIANDPRYKQGNYDGAIKAIEKLAKGLSKHPDVANVLKRTNEDINERYSVKFSYSKGGKIANAYYDDKDEAEKFIKSVISKGGKAIMTTEDVGDYLKSKLNSTQIQNIKKTWQNKKASDVTPAVKAHIKNMDIPTQLAIKQANIPHISKLVEVKEDASNMAQAKATGTQKRIADLTTSIKDKEDRARDIDPSDKTKLAIHKADMNHMKLKLGDLKDKSRMDKQKRALAAQNEPKLPNRLMAVEQIHPAKSLIEDILKKRSKK